MNAKVLLGRCNLLIDFQKLNPKGLSLLDVIRGLAERYSFAKSPQHVMDYNSEKALEFQAGTFRYQGESYLVGLKIFNNGLSADSLNSTGLSEKFVDDILKWVEQAFSLPTSHEPLRKSFLSHLEVESDLSLDLVNTRLTGLAQMISQHSTALDGKPRVLKLNALSYWSDDMGRQEAPAAFRFERKWGTSFDDKVYFSVAPMRTKHHIEVIQELEQVVTRQAGPT